MAWGNTLFEWSLIRAGIGGDWLEPLREAVARFRDGGAKEEDIKNAMELHLFRDEFSLPPNPKTTGAVAAENVKGLPSLPKKKPTDEPAK